MLADTKKKVMGICKRILPIVIGLAIIGGFVLKLGLSRIISSAVGANIYLLLFACALLASAMLLKSLRWHLLLKPLGLNNYKVTSYSYFLGQITNEILPTGSGELVRIAVLKQRSSVSFVSVIPAVIAERFFDITLLLLLSILLTTVYLNEIMIMLFAGALIACLLFILRPGFIKAIARHTSGFSGDRGLLSKMALLVSGKLIELSDSISFYGRHRNILIVNALITGVAWVGLECISQYVLSIGFGIHVSVISMLGVVALSWILGTVSMLPGGLGAREFVYALALSNIGVPFELGISVAIVYRAMVYILFAVLAGVTYLQIKSDRLPFSVTS